MTSEKKLELQIEKLKAEVQIANQQLQEEIEKRCLAEKELLKEQRFIKQIISNLPNMILVNNLDGEIILQNQAVARMYESKNQDFNNTNQSKFERIIQTNIESTSITEETFILPTGECRNFQIVKILIFDDEKNYYLTICTDITENKSSEKIDVINNDEKNQARQIISTFITKTSHEFRTPLTTILGSTELLMFYSNSWSEDKIKKYLNRIEDSVKHMMLTLDNLLFLENEI
jgi:PAS domain S-box-containing protein